MSLSLFLSALGSVFFRFMLWNSDKWKDGWHCDGFGRPRRTGEPTEKRWECRLESDAAMGILTPLSCLFFAK